ncbi:hypothetical protein D9758_004850 [Tetrapyrgos nigripes]|uniref:SCP domain-containing protein n=1 Tax=Tetrapyrgos nigripes TaxID=182062 RepID=A0A8H5G6D3_9AGAR|nr:hypothetical protein D9758_004850 [Tetrapyrgos nigripes]
MPHMVFITSLLLLLIPFTLGLVVPHDDQQLTTRGSTSFSQVVEYLDAHNVIRRGHATDDLTWSWTLANMASTWADKCLFTPSHGVLSDKLSYGENMVAATGDFSPTAAVQTFVSDESAYDPANPTYNHFTQVVWKGTTEVGCSFAKCSNIFDSSQGEATFHVCFYNPPGNVVGEALDNVQL